MAENPDFGLKSTVICFFSVESMDNGRCYEIIQKKGIEEIT